MVTAGESFPKISLAGDRAILVTFGPEYSAQTSRAVLAFDAALADAPDGVIETSPTIRSALVVFDPLALAPEVLTGWCRSLLLPEHHRIYGYGDFGLIRSRTLHSSAASGPSSTHCPRSRRVLPFRLRECRRRCGHRPAGPRRPAAGHVPAAFAPSIPGRRRPSPDASSARAPGAGPRRSSCLQYPLPVTPGLLPGRHCPWCRASCPRPSSGRPEGMLPGIVAGNMREIGRG